METTYLSTSIEPDDTLWIIFASLAALSLVNCIVTAIISRGRAGAGTTFFILALLFTVPALGFNLNATAKAKEEDAANLTQNIHTAYDVDDVKLNSTSITTEDGTVMWEATVYKGDTAYEVEIRQDEKTYEPTLISFESDEHIRELKK